MKHLYQIQLVTDTQDDEGKTLALNFSFYGSDFQAERLFSAVAYSLNCSGFVRARLILVKPFELVTLNKVEFRENKKFNNIIGG